jgi:hypothetical protein
MGSQGRAPRQEEGIALSMVLIQSRIGLPSIPTSCSWPRRTSSTDEEDKPDAKLKGKHPVRAAGASDLSCTRRGSLAGTPVHDQ